ncbi:hypothetical protein N7495_004747 [Penicillium taxi]|uniref:uncharacterized protein n=1 Tax=Penicillium taxi TaxID=168475 RepID=UPI0025456B13|nr:uncharacterized protein N7495_004747 [Penicillium taxi]KAJ5900003.1 hypothetical protein N7495_004747 [Penicillium taxi]
MSGAQTLALLLSTSTFTTVFSTTSTVTSSSAIASCTIAQSASITCSNGYYNTYGSQWEEFCSASVSGGTVYESSAGYSLRACMSGCAVNSQCTGVYWDSAADMCYLMSGDLTITSGGEYQAASRLSANANPCLSTFIATETDTVTSTEEVVYTVTLTSTPSVSTPAIASSFPVIAVVGPIEAVISLSVTVVGPIDAVVSLSVAVVSITIVGPIDAVVSLSVAVISITVVGPIVAVVSLSVAVDIIG